MNKSHARFLMVFAVLAPCRCALAFETPVYKSTVAVFLEPDAAAKQLGASDEFTKVLTPYDLQVRLNTDKPVGEKEYLDLASKQTLKWENGDIDAIVNILREVKPQIENYKLPMPARIQLVKSTCREEAGASYCRGNMIVLSSGMLKRLDFEELKHLLLHELFHICTRQNEAWRKHLYAVIGFQPCNNLNLPEDFRQRLVTNPDAHRNDYYISVKDDNDQVDAIPLLIGKGKAYDPQKYRGLFDAFNFRLVAIEKSNNGWQLKPTENGQPRTINPVTNKSFLDQIGRNTNYIISPEEILADTFPLTVMNKRPKSPVVLARFIQAMLMPPDFEPKAAPKKAKDEASPRESEPEKVGQ